MSVIVSAERTETKPNGKPAQTEEAPRKATAKGRKKAEE